MTPSNTETTAAIGRVKVKICGLTNLEDAQVAAEAGADLLGFIFYEKSPRYVTPDVVREITRELRHPPLATRPSPPILVGVFVNTAPEQILETLSYCRLDLAQLHGEEDVATTAILAGKAFKALRPRTVAEAQEAVSRFAPYSPTNGPDILLDAWHPALWGGTGETGDWSLAADLTAHHRVLLAGGLTPGNVAEAIRQARPWGVDVASGVEASPGRKDHGRVREFVAAVKVIGNQ